MNTNEESSETSLFDQTILEENLTTLWRDVMLFLESVQFIVKNGWIFLGIL